MKNPRLAALKAIAAVDAGRYSQEALASEASLLEPRDRQLCSDLVYGTLRNRAACRRLLAKVLARPGKLPAEMLTGLEIAVYALMHQSRTPDYAVLNETVALIKKRFGKTLAGVANAALHGILRMNLEDPALFGRGVAGRTAAHSLPEGIFELWQTAYGKENALAISKRSSQRPYAGLRINLLTREGAELLAALAKYPVAQKIGNAGVAFPPGTLPRIIMGSDLQTWQKKGVLSFQAAGSMLILEKLAIEACHPIWDACAGAGGKTCAMLEAGLDVPLATDPAGRRLATLASQCRRLGLPAPGIVRASAAAPPVKTWEGNILADVPCSGLGVLARRPDIKGRWDPLETDNLVLLQEIILNGLAPLLQPGRELYYITCTLNPMENEMQMQSLIARFPGLELVSQWQTPHGHPWLEGMFGAKIINSRHI